jgi:small subunit ribosomal protein S2
MKKMPDVIFVVDSIYEKQAVKEANNLNIPVYAIANTNGDDTVVSKLIPANTNSVKSLEYLSNSIAECLT